MFDGDNLIGLQGPTDANRALYRDWLAQLCLCIPHVKEAYGYFPALKKLNDDIELLSYPEQSHPEANVLSALESSILRDEVVYEFFTRNNESLCAVVCANHNRRQFAGELSAVALVFPKFETEQLEALTKLIKSNFSWLEVILRWKSGETPLLQGGGDLATNNTLANNLASELNSWLMEPNAASCAATLANDLANKFSCERTVLGKIGNNNSELIAISGVSKPEPRQHCNQACLDLIDTLAAFDDGIYCSSDRTESTLVAAYEKYKLSANAHHFTIIIYTASDSSRYGAIFEGTDEALDRQLPASIEADDHVLMESTLIPGLEILSLKSAAEPGSFDKLVTRSTQFLGKGNLKSKLILITSVALVCAATLVPLEFKISAPIILEGSSQRAIVAPFESFIRAAHVQAGMTVHEGEPLVELDQTKLELELDKWQSEKTKLSREYDRALAELNHAEAQILRAQLGQADAELNLVNSKLTRTVLQAPFDGVVISGDLGDSLGAPTTRGEVLLEVAPLNGYRVVLSVDEKDIAQIQTAQLGALTLNAMPGKRWPFKVTNVASAAPGEDGEHLFRVEAELSKISEQLRPGMQGIGKISVGQESLAYQLSRRFLGWLQLTSWSTLP